MGCIIVHRSEHHRVQAERQLSGGPSGTGSAWQYETGAGDGKSQLIGIGASSVFRSYDQIGHCFQYSGLKPCGIGIDQEKQGSVGQQSGAFFDQVEYTVLDLPGLALGTSALGGRIHNDAVIFIASPELSLYELQAVVHQPSDRSVDHSGQRSVFLSPGHHTLGSIHMGDGCAG